MIRIFFYTFLIYQNRKINRYNYKRKREKVIRNKKINHILRLQIQNEKKIISDQKKYLNF